MTMLIAILLATSTLPLVAQWLNYPDPRTPRTKEGKPNLSAPAPRINGKPDLSGVWQAERTPESEFARVLGNDPARVQIDLKDVTKHAMNVFWVLNPWSSGNTPLLQGEHDIGGLDAADGCLQGNFTSAEARWHRQVDLVKAGAGQARKRRCHADLVDVQRHWIGGWRRSGKCLARGNRRVGWPKSRTEKFNRVARLRGNGWITE
jgi:hypothetical protein